MERSKRLVVVAHCILNSNSKVTGLSRYPGALEPLVVDCIRKGMGIVQLPCPELTFLGLKRWGMTHEQYDTRMYRKHCKNILEPFVFQIEDYLVNGYSIEEIVGVDGSPSCGVTLTCTGFSGGEPDDAVNQHKNLSEVRGMGVMMETFTQLLSEKSINIPFSAINEKKPFA